jgi:hypothetical protein
MAEPVIKIMVEERTRTWYTINKKDLSEGDYIDEDGHPSQGLTESMMMKLYESCVDGEKNDLFDVHILKEGEIK